MDSPTLAYVVNTTPKYFYLLPFHFLLVRRYAPSLAWGLYIATEQPTHPIIQECVAKYAVRVLPLGTDNRHFLESRLAAVRALPVEIKYVFPIQEDFLLQYRADDAAIARAVKILDTDATVASIRLMPCPGPSAAAPSYNTEYSIVNNDPMVFTFQATLFRRAVYERYMTKLIAQCNGKTEQEKRHAQLVANIAENGQGQTLFRSLFNTQTHLAWKRAHPAPNAVYLCPWPYRPTAVEKGVLQKWVDEFIQREGGAFV